MKKHGDFEIVGRTRDDAAGEAFDKAGKLLGLDYPGGPALAALAKAGNEKKIPFPIAEMDKSKANKWDYSFSGLKTSLLRQLQTSQAITQQDKANLAAGFQWAVVRSLTETALLAAESLEVETLLVVGGVAANARLRQELTVRTKVLGTNLLIPPPWLCTDNAAMVGSAACYKRSSVAKDEALDCEAGLPLSNWS
jgi:N6-L-threonylcarbamoyladenine synthase